MGPATSEVPPKVPLVPGHEGVGVVEGLGAGTESVAVGDRVALPWLGHACGRCRYCVAGWETCCTAPQYMGYTMDGGYAEYAVAYASHVVPVPPEVSSLDASPLTCAGVTTYKALKVADPQPNETALVVGVGDLGHLALDARGDVAADLAALGGVDVALVTVPSPVAMRTAHAALNPTADSSWWACLPTTVWSCPSSTPCSRASR